MFFASKVRPHKVVSINVQPGYRLFLTNCVFDLGYGKHSQATLIAKTKDKEFPVVQITSKKPQCPLAIAIDAKGEIQGFKSTGEDILCISGYMLSDSTELLSVDNRFDQLAHIHPNISLFEEEIANTGRDFIDSQAEEGEEDSDSGERDSDEGILGEEIDESVSNVSDEQNEEDEEDISNGSDDDDEEEEEDDDEQNDRRRFIRERKTNKDKKQQNQFKLNSSYKPQVEILSKKQQIIENPFQSKARGTFEVQKSEKLQKDQQNKEDDEEDSNESQSGSDSLGSSDDEEEEEDDDNDNIKLKNEREKK
ncbi:MAG: hypothetical protein EZS28_036225, partial [Streblomastix strix]